MARADELQRHAVAMARLQDTLTDQFARDLDRSLSTLNRRIRRLVLSLDLSDGRLVSTQANLGRALRLRADILNAIQAAGYTSVATSSVDEPLDRLTQRVLRGQSIAAQAGRLTPVDVDTLSAFKNLRLAELLDLGDDMATALTRAITDGVLGARDVADLVDELEGVLEVTNRQARTIYDTALTTYGRSVEQLQATGEQDELFFYGGPADAAVRPFCRERVGKVYTREQIGNMSNGQLPNVMLTGGGYNCRHQWQLVSRLDAELRGLVDGGRLSSIERQLERVA